MKSAHTRTFVATPDQGCRLVAALVFLGAVALAAPFASAQSDDCATGTTTADFATGVASGVAVSEADSSAGGGQLRLQAEASDLFLSPTLDSAWVVTRGGSQPVISNGVLEGQIYAAGTPVTSAMEMTTTYGDGTACETRALIQPGSNFSSIGFFSSTGTSVQWAYFSTFGTGDDPVPVIHTVVRDSSGAIVGVPTAITLDQWHDLRVVLLPGAVEFWADGVLIDTRNNVRLTLPQRFGYYKSSGSSSSLLIDWVRITPYTATAGSYESAIQDGGGQGTTWTELAWTGTTPAGADVTYETRTGETPVPDGSWSGWDALAGSTVASPPGRYAQYRASLATADLMLSPVIDQVQFCYETPRGHPGPDGGGGLPLADATGVPVDAVVTATFNEMMDPLTLDAVAFTLTPAGGSPIAATVALESTGTSRR